MIEFLFIIAEIKFRIMKKIFSTRYSELSFNISMFLLRLGIGSFLFLNHGMMKLNRFSDLKERFSDPFHVGSSTSLMLVLFAEAVCSLLLVLGLLSRLAALVLIILFFTIIFIIDKDQPFLKSEMASLYLIGSIIILLCGPGKWSIDKLIGK